MSVRIHQQEGDFQQRLPPMWWIKRRIKVIETNGNILKFEASYGSKKSWFAVTSDTAEDAVEALIAWLKGVKDGSLLEEYYRGRIE